MRKILIISALFLGSLALQAQGARELIEADVLRAGGVYYMYPFKEHTVTPPPRGYTPVYLSHYGRHGARYLEKEIQYERVLEPLRAAHEANALTEAGERLWQEASAYYEETCLYRAGDLTPLGWEQHFRIAQEIYRDNRSFFKKRPSVRAGATQVPRCIVSMTAFCQGLLKMEPKLEIYTEASSAELDALNPRAKENPRHTVPPETEGRYKRKDPWGTGLREFTDRRIDHKAMCARWFKDPEFTVPFRGTRAFVADLFDLVFNMPCTGTSRSLLWVFLDEEIYPLWEIDNYRYYMGAATPATLRDAPVLRHLVADADAALLAGTPAVRLRFGHDTVVLALLSMMGADGYGIIPENADGISAHWWNFRSPMAATLYLLFCKNKQGDVIFKLVLNGDEVTLPLTPVSGPWYRWADCKSYITNIIAL